MSGAGLAYADRVKESTSTTGTGTISLGGAVASYQAFATAFAAACDVYYGLSDGTNWEVGVGTYTPGSPGTLARNIVLASSNSGALVSIASAATVWVDLPAKAVADRGMSMAFAACMTPQ